MKTLACHWTQHLLFQAFLFRYLLLGLSLLVADVTIGETEGRGIGFRINETLYLWLGGRSFFRFKGFHIPVLAIFTIIQVRAEKGDEENFRVVVGPAEGPRERMYGCGTKRSRDSTVRRPQRHIMRASRSVCRREGSHVSLVTVAIYRFG